MALDGGKRFGEHRWRPRKLATGSFGREEGWRRGLRGGLEGGGAHDGGGGRFQQRGARSMTLELRKEGDKGEDGSELAGMV